MSDTTVDPWQEDPEFPPSDWIAEVFAGDTRRGYIDWVAAKKEESLQEGASSETNEAFIIERRLMERMVIHSRIAIQAASAEAALELAKQAAENEAGDWYSVFEEMAAPGCDEYRIVGPAEDGR